MTTCHSMSEHSPGHHSYHPISTSRNPARDSRLLRSWGEHTKVKTFQVSVRLSTEIRHRSTHVPEDP